MVRFPEELKDVPVVRETDTNPIANPTGEVPSENKNLYIDFIMNHLKIGDFTDKIEFINQEMIVDKIIELCQFYSISVPKTFKQAMRSPEKDEWSKAIAVELSNLECMRVWVIGLLPPDKRP